MWQHGRNLTQLIIYQHDFPFSRNTEFAREHHIFRSNVFPCDCFFVVAPVPIATRYSEHSWSVLHSLPTQLRPTFDANGTRPFDSHTRTILFISFIDQNTVWKSSDSQHIHTRHVPSIQIRMNYVAAVLLLAELRKREQQGCSQTHSNVSYSPFYINLWF